LFVASRLWIPHDDRELPELVESAFAALRGELRSDLNQAEGDDE
jgi:hypothetical protein